MESIELLLVGSIFTITGVVLYFVTRGLRNNKMITTAKVVGHKVVDDVDDSKLYEIFKFQDSTGKVQKAKSLFGTSFGYYSKGDDVEIVYDKVDPTKALPNKPILLYAYLIPIMLGIILIITHLLSNS